MVSAPSPQSVGWIGTGRMGAPLATRLARAGYSVTAWNRTRAKAEALQSHGVNVADQIGDLANSDAVFTMVSTSEDLKQVVTELLAQERRPRYVIDCSTVSIEGSQVVRGKVEAAGVAFLASPVSGNGKVVKAGLLSLVCSGPQDAYDALAPMLATLGKHVTYVGEGERSRLVKICHNLMLGVVTQNLAEITVLAEKGGVSRAAFLEFLNNSVMGSMFTRYKTPAFVNLDFTPTFTPTLLRKDFDLGLALAGELGVPMPVVAAAREPVQATLALGHEKDDFAVLLLLQALVSGLELTSEDIEVDDGLAPAE
ncbi:MAG: 3-hydroxyisobutyrate dehydrogenase [Pseudonocardiales bacterium]|jgi:3-hydroxyisobutyrate dehydrogenase-like beta-hydroxyacid dehydrogenase|nr:3-hydroxyisobutyrate dehydrogenase [Pseudonocardiales bacterium]